MKFIHAADVHLDSPLRNLEDYEGAPVEEIRNATRRAFENLIALALEEKVDVVLIAGDLFDGDWKDYNTGLFLVRQLARLAAACIPVVIIAGNHDAAGRLTTALPYPANVTLLSHLRPETHLLEEPRIAIHGQSFARREITTNLAAVYPPPRPGYFNIGLLHTSLTGREGHAPYAPCTVEELAAKGYDYWALGHAHSFERVNAEPPIVFAGCLQGRHIRETGPKGCVLVQVDERDSVQITPCTLDVVRWVRIEIDVSQSRTLEECLACWRTQLQQIVATETPVPLMVRAVFRGVGPIHNLLQGDPQQLKQAVRAAAIEVGKESVWVEKVQLETRAAHAAISSDATGALAEISRFTEELGADHETVLNFVEQHLGEMLRRLPQELKANFDPPSATKLLDQAQALLSRRLTDKEQPA